MNKIITEVKNTLGKKSIAEPKAEEQVSKREDRMVEMRTVPETFGTTLNAPTFKL